MSEPTPQQITPSSPSVRRFISASVSNFKRLKYVEIRFDPDHPLLRVGGRNRQGKSSLCDSFLNALYGDRFKPVQPVREGQASSETVLELEGLKLVKEFDADGTSRFAVIDAVKGRRGRPREVMDELLGITSGKSIAVDPTLFSGMKPKDQVEVALRAFGLSAKLDVLNQQQAIIYQKRHDARNDLDRVINTIEKDYTGLPDMCPPAIDVAAESAERDRKISENAKRNQAESSLATFRIQVAHIAQRDGLKITLNSISGDLKSAFERCEEQRAICDDLEKKLAEARAELARRIESHKSKDAESQSIQSKLAVIPEHPELGTLDEAKAALAHAENAFLAMPVHDVKGLDTTIQNAKAVDAVRAKVIRRDELIEESKQKKTIWLGYESEYKQLDNDKANILMTADIPVPGLKFGADCLTLNDRPLKDASDSEQDLIGLAVAMAPSPEIRFLVVRNGDRLDEDSLRSLDDLAKRRGFQGLIECVHADESDTATIILEDGEIKPMEKKQ